MGNKSKGDLFITQAEFARLNGVSRKTVTVWKQQGYCIMTAGGQVDVVASNKMLRGRPDCYRGGVVTHRSPVNDAG